MGAKDVHLGMALRPDDGPVDGRTQDPRVRSGTLGACAWS
jgi:hypothetical protein